MLAKEVANRSLNVSSADTIMCGNCYAFFLQARSGAVLFLENAPLSLCKVNKTKIVLPFMVRVVTEKGGNKTHRIFRGCESFESFSPRGIHSLTVVSNNKENQTYQSGRLTLMWS